MLSRVSTPWASVLRTIVDAGVDGEAGVAVGEVAAVGVAVDLDHRAGAGGGLGDRLDVDPVGLAAADQAAGEVADAVDVRVLDRGEDALGHLLFGDREGGVDAGDDPVERRDQVVGVVERAVEADVDLRAGEQAEALASPLFQARISSIRSQRRSAVTWSPKPWLAEWSVIAM